MIFPKGFFFVFFSVESILTDIDLHFLYNYYIRCSKNKKKKIHVIWQSIMFLWKLVARLTTTLKKLLIMYKKKERVLFDITATLFFIAVYPTS